MRTTAENKPRRKRVKAGAFRSGRVSSPPCRRLSCLLLQFSDSRSFLRTTTTSPATPLATLCNGQATPTGPAHKGLQLSPSISHRLLMRVPLVLPGGHCPARRRSNLLRRGPGTSSADGLGSSVLTARHRGVGTMQKICLPRPNRSPRTRSCDPLATEKSVSRSSCEMETCLHARSCPSPNSCCWIACISQEIY